MRVTVAVATSLLLAGCVDQGPGPQPKKIEPAYIDAHLLKEVPTDAQRVDVVLGDGEVVYLGNTIDRAAVAPGGPVKLTHYWQVKKPVGPGWRVFTLLRGGAGSADFMNLPITDMELGHGPTSWRAGEIIADPQDIVLRPDWHSATATLQVGLIRVGEHGTGDRMQASGAHTQDRAVIARTLTVDLTKAPPPPGTVYLPRASGPIAIDGVAADLGWAGIPMSPEFQTAEGSPEPVGKATAKLTWDDENLYVFVTVTDTDIVSAYKNHDDSLWKADDVEVFIDADGNRKGYVELQVNPNNATFDSWFVGTRAPPGGDPTWDSGMKTAVKLRGTTETGDTDLGWDAEIAIPWAAVKGRDDAMNVQLPPHVGDKMHLNVVRVDSTTGDKAQAASSWNRITYGDFHALDRMLTVVFADATGSVTPKPTDGSGSGSDSGSAIGAGSGNALGTGSAARGSAAGSGSGSAVLPSR